MDAKTDGRKTTHSELSVRTRLKGGRLAGNHSPPGLKVRSGLMGGHIIGNHNRRPA